MSTVQVINVKHPSSASNNIVLDSSGNATMAGNMAMNGSFLRNRIINGAMMIDQRNAGASVSNGVGAVYSVDRWAAVGFVAGKFTVQQNAGSVSPPAGFSNYLGVTSSSSYSVPSGEYYGVSQYIEGFNTSDLGFGTANASTITISFWVRSSLTGSFGGALRNSADDRSYPFGFTINSANTWEKKSVTIAGDTSGTWVGATNGVGLRVCFSLGAGSSYKGPANAWASASYQAPTGENSVVGTNGATFYLTGVQLEVGTVATPFERRLYPQELAMCQRYCYVADSGALNIGIANQTTTIWMQINYPVTMRSTPTGSTSGQLGISDNYAADFYASPSVGSQNASQYGGRYRLDGWSGLTLTRVYSGLFNGVTTPGKITFNAEL